MGLKLDPEVKSYILLASQTQYLFFKKLSEKFMVVYGPLWTLSVTTTLIKNITKTPEHPFYSQSLSSGTGSYHYLDMLRSVIFHYFQDYLNELIPLHTFLRLISFADHCVFGSSTWLDIAVVCFSSRTAFHHVPLWLALLLLLWAFFCTAFGELVYVFCWIYT